MSISKKLGLVFAVIIFLFVSFNLFSQILTTLKSGDRLEEATDKLHSLEVKNKELKRKLEQVNNPLFIEEQARDKLGLVREGETIVIIPEEKLNQVLGVTRKGEEIRLPNWQGWLKLFWQRD